MMSSWSICAPIPCWQQGHRGHSPRVAWDAGAGQRTCRTGCRKTAGLLQSGPWLTFQLNATLVSLQPVLWSPNILTRLQLVKIPCSGSSSNSVVHHTIFCCKKLWTCSLHTFPGLLYSQNDTSALLCSSSTIIHLKVMGQINLWHDCSIFYLYFFSLNI